MFREWLIQDIERAAIKSNRVVISDPQRFLAGFSSFSGYDLITLNSNAEEMEARIAAQTVHSGKKVILLCFFPKHDIRHLLEFAGIGAYVDFDNPDSYIRKKLYESLGVNVGLPEAKLLLSAKLSDGKDLRWWKGIVNEAIEPLDKYELLPGFIENPVRFKEMTDEDVYAVFRDEIFKHMGKNTMPLDAPALLRELSATIFAGLAYNNISEPLLHLYYWWCNSSNLQEAMKAQVAAWNIPTNATPQTAHPDHPFAVLDKKAIEEIGRCLRNGISYIDLADALRKRIKSRHAETFKPSWLEDLLILLDFDSSSMYRYDSLAKVTEYYRTKFAKLDAAMRHLYNQWLSEPQLLRPLQELYESHLKSLLSVWFSCAPQSYQPTQLGIVAQALTEGNKVAVMVCDGLRLEIAEAIAAKLKNTAEISHAVRHAKLPSVTENGMSALFGIDEVVTTTAPRFAKLQETFPDVDIRWFDRFGSDVSAQKLVVLYGDIDNVGEHKGLAGLKDINNYEAELADTIRRLHGIGYQKVFLTSDHGFVITGILDEANKIIAPTGVDVKERFFLTDDFINDSSFIRREDNFPGSSYQYYAKSDKPFKTRGAYGYAHGGFTPQECLIPMYCFTSLQGTSSLKVEIENKAELAAVTGQYFSVKLSGNDNSKGKRLRVHLYVDGFSVNANIVKISDTGDATTEFEVESGNMSIIVQDIDSGAQLDSAPVIKSHSRDIDDLF